MNIVLVYLGRKGGGSIYSLEIAKEMSKNENLLCIVSKNSENIIQWRQSGVKIIEFDTYKDFKSMVFSILKVRKFFRLKRDILKFKPDVIYHPMLHTFTPIVNLLLYKIPRIVTLHDPLPHKGEENIILDKISRIIARRSSRVIILSEIFKKNVIDMGVDKNIIDVIPHGEFSYYSNSMKKTDFNNKIIFFGRISKYKGIDVLLEIFKLIKEGNKDAELLIVGSGDITEYKELIEQCKDVTVVNRWINDSEVEHFFSQADILAIPYIDASQSGVIPLAYGFAMPVVAFRVGGIPEQITDGETGFLVEPTNIIEFANKCVYLLDNPNVIEKMGYAGLVKSKQEMGWDRVCELLNKSFKQVIAG